jgi:hypothetical protein
MPVDLKENLVRNLDSALKHYTQDLEALPEEALLNAPAPAARAAIDYSYEVAFVNRHIAGVLRGESPAWPEMDGWMTCPDPLRNKAAIIEEVNSSVEVLKASLGDDVAREMPNPMGEGTRTAFDVASFMAMHMNYHDGQLNLLQSIHGDGEMNWK